MLDMVRSAIIDLMGPEAIERHARERQQTIYQERGARDAEHGREQAALADEKRRADVAHLKAREFEQTKREALRAAEEKTFKAARDASSVNGRIVAVRSQFERFMRETAPTDFLRTLMVRVDDVLRDTVPKTTTLDMCRDMRQINVPVSSNVDDRRRALLRLRARIQNEWPLLALTEAGFEERLEAELASLPAEVPPPTVEEYIRQTNGTAA